MMYNPFSLTNKKIFITGASSGIGKATAIESAKMGASLIITGRHVGRLNETYKLLEGKGHEQIVADLGDVSELRELVNSLPLLDGCVHCAGVLKLLLTQFINKDELDRIFQINTIAPILLTQSLIKKKKLNKPSSIVFMSSLAGIYNVSLGNGMYSASKGALNGFMKNAALDLASKGVRCNSVNPGLVLTNMKNTAITNEQLMEHKKLYPLKRFGKPEEIAYAVIYLLSDAASWITGTSLLIDGGFTLQ